jgi:hypothetical protein
MLGTRATGVGLAQYMYDKVLDGLALSGHKSPADGCGLDLLPRHSNDFLFVFFFCVLFFFKRKVFS